MTDEIFDEAVDEVIEKPRMAPQDIPWPDDELPKGTTQVTNEQARLVLTNGSYRPSKHSLGDTALVIDGEWSDKHARMLITFMWDGIKPGSSLYLPRDFGGETPPVRANPSKIKNYKKYTK